MNNYHLTDADVKTIVFALSIFPSLPKEESAVQADINNHLCRSAGEKLIKSRSDLNANEFRAIFSSLLAVRLILQGELDVDSETKKECSNYLFSVNKLLSSMEKDFS